MLVLDADKTLEDIVEQYKKNENKILGRYILNLNNCGKLSQLVN